MEAPTRRCGHRARHRQGPDVPGPGASAFLAAPDDSTIIAHVGPEQDLPMLRPGDEVHVGWAPDASRVLSAADIPTTEDLEEMLDDLRKHWRQSDPPTSSTEHPNSKGRAMPAQNRSPTSHPTRPRTAPRAAASSAAARGRRRARRWGRPSWPRAAQVARSPASHPRRPHPTTAHRPPARSGSRTGRCTWPTASSPRFQTASGLTVDYKEDFNDNEQWFAKVKEPLSRKQDIGADLAVPTQFMAARLARPRLAQRDQRRRRPQQEEPAQGPARLEGRSRPQVHRALHDRHGRAWPTTRPPPSATSPRSTICGIRRSRAGSACCPTYAGRARHDHAVGRATFRREPDHGGRPEGGRFGQGAEGQGQIRRFTGNDYADDLAAGNIAVAQAYSGDVVQLQADNPDLQFIVPESGGDWFIDTMVIPYTTQNQKARRGVDQLRLRPGQLRQADRVHPVRAGVVGHDRRAQQDRSQAGAATR